MKVADLRKQIKETDQKLVNQAFVELYKLLPKKSKEELADPLIQEIFAGKKASASQVKKKAKEPFDADAFIRQSKEMLKYANDGYYYIKNNMVPPRKQGGWRFEIKRIIKTVHSFGPDTPEYPAMQDLLFEVYKTMARACWSNMFHSDDIFDSIDMEQTELFDQVVAGQLNLPRDPERLTRLAELSVSGGLDRKLSHADLGLVLRDHLSDNEELEIIVNWVKEYAGAEKYAYNHTGYNVMRPVGEWRSAYLCKCNEAVEFGFQVCFDMKQEQQGIDLFSEYYLAPDPETNLFRLLVNLHYTRCSAKQKWWVKAYEDAVAKGVEPRDYITETYRRYTGTA